MAIPYLLGLTVGSIAVISWKHLKAEKITLSEAEAVQGSETDPVSDTKKTSSTSSSKKQKA